MLHIFVTSLFASFLFEGTFAGDFSWKHIRDARALCNDYTPAGYFVANGRTPEHWVIFLESGGGCYSPETCNARYFNENVRMQFKDSSSPSVGPLIKYDVSKAKSSVINEKTPLNGFVSPLVTSIATFQGTSYFPNGITVKGQGILDDDCTTNPVFCNHTRVIIPYCSSDLWLANSPSLSCNISKDLYDQCYANVSSCAAIGKTFFEKCFLNSSNPLSFVFRGQAIYRGAIQQLLNESLADISSVTLVGSSAGGVGVINHANWTLQRLRDRTHGANLSVVADSSWFVNFQDSVYKVFVGLAGSGPASVFDIIAATDTSSVTCNDTSRGTPCCFSAFCMLSNPQYYPSKDVSTFMLFGLYDVYLLAQSLIGLDTSNAEQKDDLAVLVKLIQTVSEYGGAMNNSLSVSSRGVERLSYYVTECFQHIYLVTSTLWGEGNLFGNQAMSLPSSFASFSQSMKPDIWHSMQVGTNRTTIRDALSRWYPNRYNRSVVTIRDNCTGPRCNSMCPDDILLGVAETDQWGIPVQFFLLATVVGVALCCLLAKAFFWLWYVHMGMRQKGYLAELFQNTEEGNLQFPECADDNAVSVSCLNLCYSVTVRTTKVKDEKRDDRAPVVLKRFQSENHGSIDGSTTTYPSTPAFGNVREYILHYSKRKSEAILGASQSSQPPPSPSGCCNFYTTKNILKGISIYFNPGDLCAIMGPSGCGKTTLLDLLTGRRTAGNVRGHIYVNGLPIEQIKNWYIANTGYVLQLATPYYEELTVRENLTLAAQIKLPSTFSMREKFIRIEQVMAVSELRQFANVVVGGASGPGLSGGQKRRLAIALQLLKLPSVLFLDEPTSGLDATSSYELLTHLNKLADSKRTVILTIHQPRLEIFHMFNRLVLLTDGKVAYHGVPDKAYEVFIKALQIKYWRNAPQLENENPADVIMDMAGSHKLRAVVTDYYEKSDDPHLVRRAIMQACYQSKSKSLESFDSVTQKFKYALYGVKRVSGHHGGFLTRLAALEARGGKRASLGQMLYLPVIFFAYGVLLGTVYYQSKKPLLVMSGFCVYSVASALFMFPALSLYYQRALEVYAYEHADGVGSPWDIVIQGFIRGITLGFFPVILCAGILYLLLVNAESYDLWVFGQVLLVNLALNQTWVALLIFVICAFPNIAFRLSPVISSVAGFTSGFFVPRESMPPYYRWLFYINPNYYGFSASANLLLNSLETGCDGSIFECFPSSSQYYLKYFNFDDVNPYRHIAILLGFTLFYLILATLSNAVRSSHHMSNIKRLAYLLKLHWVDCGQGSEVASNGSMDASEDGLTETACAETEIHETGSEVPVSSGRTVVAGDETGTEVKERAKVRWQKIAKKCTTLPVTDEDKVKRKVLVEKEARMSLFLHEGEGHFVWKPKGRRGQTPLLAAVVGQVLELPRSLSERRKNLEKRVQATRAVLKEDSRQNLNAGPPLAARRHMTFKDAANKVKSQLHQSEGYHFHDVVSQYVSRMHVEHSVTDGQSLELNTVKKQAVRNISAPILHSNGAPLLALDLSTSGDRDLPNKDQSHVNDITLEDDITVEVPDSTLQDAHAPPPPVSGPHVDGSSSKPPTNHPSSQANSVSPLPTQASGSPTKPVRPRKLSRQEEHLEKTEMLESWC